MSKKIAEAPSLGAMRVAEVACAADVTPATIRYYARIKLLSPKRDLENGYRYFSRDDVRRVGFIRQAQSLGLTIADIKTILTAVDNGGSPCEQVRSLVTERLLRIQEQIVELRAAEARISDAIASWHKLGSPSPQDGEFCPLIEQVELATCIEPSEPRRRPRRTPMRKACRYRPQDGEMGTLSLA